MIFFLLVQKKLLELYPLVINENSIYYLFIKSHELYEFKGSCTVLSGGKFEKTYLSQLAQRVNKNSCLIYISM